MKWMILIGLGVLGSLATLVLTAELGHAENNGFQEDDGDILEEAYRLFIDNDPDEEMINKRAIGDIMLEGWFTDAAHSVGSWTKKAGHDAGKWTAKAMSDAGKWTGKAVHDVGGAVKKGCDVVNAIPFREFVLRMKESLRSRGISEEELSEEGAVAVATGIYKGVKTACHLIG